MSNKTIVPCIWLDDQAEEAARLYGDVLPESRVLATSRYPETADNPAGKPRGSVLTVEMDLAGLPITLLNGGPQFRVNPSVSFLVQLESPDEVDRVAGALSDGGALMPVDTYAWSRRYGWVKDRFGVTWQVTCVDEKPAEVLLPTLLFTGAQQGRAEDAMKRYAEVFPEGKVGSIARYAEGEGPVGQVKHGRCTLAEQAIAFTDSAVSHDFTFDEGLSLQVMCDNQQQIDHHWSALIEGGGQPGPCGWLKDRFGLSWQVVPRDMAKWMTAPDTAARDRAFGAIMKMTKLDIATIEAAFEGRA